MVDKDAVFTPGGAGTLLLVWDAPNVDMGIGTLVGGKPSPDSRPRFDKLGLWLLDRADAFAARAGRPIEAEAAVFTNFIRGAEEGMRGWVEALRHFGFHVFAKPKASETSDVDADMIEHIRRTHASGRLAGLIVASGDGRNFRETLTSLSRQGIPCTVLALEELAPWAVGSEDFDFVDLEEIDNLFAHRLPRTILSRLPDAGGWLPPYQPLTSLRG